MRNATLIENGFQQVATVDLDERQRVSLGRVMKHLAATSRASRYAIYFNEAGQIVLDPIVQISLSDIPPEERRWLYKDTEAHRVLAEGMASGRTGKRADLGNFSDHLTDD